MVHVSQRLVPRIYQYGRPVLCDLGEARFQKGSHTDDIQPYQYRASEVILNIPLDEKVDIWNVAVLTWDLFEHGNLFKTTGGAENKEDNVYRLAYMIALLGPPPKDLLQQSRSDQL
ncbi:hypothetical protein SERLA73DRAFT_188352 [Serpula lacrymans var. lacrymans S7.3]|uniref:Protein kinase domain-containing protein n=2 Tax=Serpula lacrymans var. lacrymans TaxID=341189 RepID=F8QB62_SERL3|nr:uncharacterized protein SERLADRAFT_478435 [Serpula lacrymans var. lacrymans S7.9]EGN94448.1 hypothetical protein SERLA73DRAFT_188352 [Serpula lacrymans var. lacrymans S7.3]EGO19932.1 hypothetical protein SERLADRAFT_478435 [Serpula lacrymans var. lacrymans S7.9]